MIVSLLMSLTIWVYVSSVEGDEYTKTFKGVAIEYTGEDYLRDTKNLVITDLYEGSVEVDVVGPRRIVAGLDASMLSAKIDVSKLSRAAYTSQQYSVIFPEGTDTSNLRVTSKTPETINFLVTQLTSKSVQVRGSFDGSIAKDYTARTPVFEPATITVSGPEANLKDIEYAWVSFGKEDVDSTYEVETGYTLMGADGMPAKTAGLSVSTDTVIATLPILMLKEVQLGVNLVDGGGATAENTKVTIEPASISLAGDSKLLSGLNKINLATIDLTEFASSFSETYPISIDNTLENTTGATEAKVTVEIIGLETKTFKVTNIDYANLPEGFEATIGTESLEVKLRGNPESLAQIKDENIRAVADLTDMGGSTGTYMPRVRIYVDGFTDVGAIGHYDIAVDIQRTGA
ncbi:MAG: hypothetical protein K6F56_07220 [Oscillospiraceae bacterium]|nr:hypothetical protein [Oscillospiraceae bacterium]